MSTHLNVPRIVRHSNRPADAQNPTDGQVSISTLPTFSPFVGHTVTDILRSKAKSKKGALTLADQPMSHIQKKYIAERGLPDTTPTGPKRKRDARDNYGSPKEKRTS